MAIAAALLLLHRWSLHRAQVQLCTKALKAHAWLVLPEDGALVWPWKDVPLVSFSSWAIASLEPSDILLLLRCDERACAWQDRMAPCLMPHGLETPSLQHNSGITCFFTDRLSVAGATVRACVVPLRSGPMGSLRVTLPTTTLVLDATLPSSHVHVPTWPPKELQTMQRHMRMDQLMPLRSCDTPRARSFRQQHAAVHDATADLFRRQARDLLLRAATVLHALEVPFWISSGTLLGWHRQCDWLPKSGDVDVGLFAEDYTPDMLGPLLAAGLRLSHRFGRVEDGFELSFDLTAGARALKLDMFFFYVDPATGMYWNGGTQARTGNKYRYDFAPFELCWATFDGVEVRVPCETGAYLEANYGNWSTPVMTWDWKKSPPNVRPHGRWAPETWPITVQCLICDCKPEQAEMQL